MQLDTQEGTPALAAPEIAEPKTPRKPSRRRRWLFGIGVVLLLAVIGLICIRDGTLQVTYSPFTIHYWPAIPQELNAWKFGGPNGDAPVTVPFTLNNGLIYVDGKINDFPVTFFLDTGAQSSTYPAQLRLGGRQYANDDLETDAAGNSVASSPMLFSQATIGNCAIRNFTAEADHPFQPKDASIHPEPVSVTLGNTALSHVVITIDYHKKVLIFAPSTAQETPASKLGRGVYHFSWEESASEKRSDGPLIYGHCSDIPLTILVDTGATGASVSPRLASILQRTKAASYVVRRKSHDVPFTYAVEKIDMLQPFDFTLDCPPRMSYHLNGAADIDPALIGDASAVVLGASALAQHVITVDYPNRTLMLTPRSASNSKQPIK